MGIENINPMIKKRAYASNSENMEVSFEIRYAYSATITGAIANVSSQCLIG